MAPIQSSTEARALACGASQLRDQRPVVNWRSPACKSFRGAGRACKRIVCRKWAFCRRKGRRHAFNGVKEIALCDQWPGRDLNPHDPCGSGDFKDSEDPRKSRKILLFCDDVSRSVSNSSGPQKAPEVTPEGTPAAIRELPPDLASVVKRWPLLSESLRRVIVAMVEEVAGSSRPR